jgi:ATP phosphoribosyltransferase
MNDKKLKIAVQKSDRISNDFLSLLSACGIQTSGAMKKLYCNFVDFPIEIYFVRGSDVPVLMNSQFDVAALGMDSFLQYQMENTTEIVRKLGFSKCHLSFPGNSTRQSQPHSGCPPA